MKTRFATILLLPVFALSAPAQTAQPQPFQAPVLLIREDGGASRAWLLAATRTAIRYRETEVAAETVDAKLSDFKSIYFYEPRDYTAAMDLYQARRYQEAAGRFSAIKERHKSLLTLPDNIGALAAFYEMECLRKLGDLDGLAAALRKFDKGALTRENQQRQIELYVMWDAVRTKSWQDIDTMAKERAKTKLPGDQRAQVAYCHGLALEGLERPNEALAAYQTALTADVGASEDIAREAALRIMAILNGDAEVRKAIKAWGTDAERRNSVGYARLQEAAAVARMFEMSLGGGAPLPAEFKELTKYQPAPGPEKKDAK
jgi:tetratricopeptide (TPR) repeat protein